MQVPPLHRKVASHLRYVRSRATPPKYFVTFGVIAASWFQIQGMHNEALWASILTNIVWIWEP